MKIVVTVMVFWRYYAGYITIQLRAHPGAALSGPKHHVRGEEVRRPGSRVLGPLLLANEMLKFRPQIQN